MNNKKYKVDTKGNKELSAAIQRAWFAMGATWCGNLGERVSHTNKEYLYLSDTNMISYSSHIAGKEFYNKQIAEEFKLSDYYKVGDRVRLVSERPENWASKGGMDHYLGAEVTIERFYDGNTKVDFIEKSASSWTFRTSDIECKIPQTVTGTIPEKSFVTTSDGTTTPSSMPTKGSYKGDDALDVYLSFFKPAGYFNHLQGILEGNILEYSQFSWADSGEAFSCIESQKQYTRSQIEQWFYGGASCGTVAPCPEGQTFRNGVCCTEDSSEYTIPITRWEDVKVGDLVEVVDRGNNDTVHEKYKKPVRIGDKFIVDTVEGSATSTRERVITSKCGFVLYGHGSYFDRMKITRKAEVILGIDETELLRYPLTPSECFIPTPIDLNKVHLPKTVIRKVENNPPKICFSQKIDLPLPDIKREIISAPTISDIKISL